MVRISKQSERRQRFPRKHRKPSKKTGPLKEAKAFNPHENALEGELATLAFIPKTKTYS